MPAPQATMMKQFARLQFISFAIKVPNQPPQMNVPATYSKAFKASEQATPIVPMPPALFIPDSPNKYHTDIAKMKTDKFGSWIDGICTAVCSAWSTWQTAATMVGVIINAMTATGGQVVGPPLMPLIMAQAPMDSPSMAPYNLAVAMTMNTAWLSYTSSIKVAGMPWYPAFTALPMPVAPPTPNIPAPLMALTQVTASMSKDALKGMMIGNFAGIPTSPHMPQLFDAIATAINQCFTIWQAATMVTNVLGTGPIPTFAPPFVPAGPVVGGVGTMTPGGFV